jgi:hypothetical protein
MYAIGRILIEDFRGDAGRGIYLGLSSGQIFSAGVLAAITGRWLFGRRRAEIRRRSSHFGSATQVSLLAILLVAPAAARAQPPARTYGPEAPQPAPAPPSSTQPPASYAPPAAGPAPYTPQPIGPAPPSQTPAVAPPSWVPMDPYARPADVAATRRPSFQAGLLVGLAAPLNRRRDQVAMLGGPSLSLGLALRSFTIGLDLDSLGNTDASHGTVLVSAGVIGPVTPRLYVGGRAGLGATLVNFDDRVFRDVAGASVRFEVIAEYDVTDSWAVWLRPLSFDILTAEALGGSILTWQIRIGAGYRFGGRHRAALAVSPPSPTSPAPRASYPPAQASRPPASPPYAPSPQRSLSPAPAMPRSP